jgi:hypothetical protein
VLRTKNTFLKVVKSGLDALSITQEEVKINGLYEIYQFVYRGSYI